MTRGVKGTGKRPRVTGMPTGRPPLHPSRKLNLITLRMSEDDLDILKAAGEGSPSRGVRSIAREYARRARRSVAENVASASVRSTETSEDGDDG